MPRDVTPRPAFVRSVEELRIVIEAGAVVKYLHFWGHQPEPDGAAGRGCLSQWFPAPFEAAGKRYRHRGALENPAAWRGLNLLGFALMEARDRLRG